MRQLAHQFLRFCVVGVVNTGIYYVVYLPVRVVVHYVAAHVLAWIVATLGSFLLNCRFTYHVRPTLRRALVYPLSNIPNLVATTAGVVALVEVFGVSQKWAPLIAGILAIPLTFLAQRALMLASWAERRPSPAPDPALEQPTTPRVGDPIGPTPEPGERRSP